METMHMRGKEVKGVQLGIEIYNQEQITSIYADTDRVHISLASKILIH